MKNRFIIFLILIAVISGLCWGFAYEIDPRPEVSGSTGEGIAFDQTAVTILEEGIFYDTRLLGATADRPFYPVFLAGIYKVFGHNYHIVTIIQVLLFVLISFLVYRLCQTLFNEKVARLAGLITALCYSIASFAGLLYREVFFTFLVVLLIYSLYRAQLTFKNIWFIVAGLIAGLALLTNSIIQIFVLVIVINFFIVCWKKGFKKIYPKVCLFIIFFGLTIIPWLSGEYLSLGGGNLDGLILRQKAEKLENLEGKYFQHFIGNTLGDFFAYRWFENYNPKEVRHGPETRARYQSWLRQDKDLAVINRIFLSEAKEIIPRHPILFIEQMTLDFLKFNTPMTPNVRMQHMFVETHPGLSDLSKTSIILSIRFIYLIFFILIIYAIVKNIRKWQKISWLFLIVLYFNFVFSSIHAIARYSVPIYPFYIILSSIGILIIWSKIRHKDENMLFNQ